MNDRVVKAYHEYMIDVAVILGADKDNATKDLKESVEFEIELARVSLDTYFKNSHDKIS